LKTAKSRISPFVRRKKKERRGVKKTQWTQTNTHKHIMFLIELRVVNLKEKKEFPFFFYIP
jgi:hypothetical protein